MFHLFANAWVNAHLNSHQTREKLETLREYKSWQRKKNTESVGGKRPNRDTSEGKKQMLRHAPLCLITKSCVHACSLSNQSLLWLWSPWWRHWSIAASLVFDKEVVFLIRFQPNHSQGTDLERQIFSVIYHYFGKEDLLCFSGRGHQPLILR